MHCTLNVQCTYTGGAPAPTAIDHPYLAGPAYQLRRYAWSAKLPLSGLTDFEEFAVYDCQRRPRPADKRLYQRQVEVTDRQIDALVYELYDLAEEEIAIVEQATA